MTFKLRNAPLMGLLLVVYITLHWNAGAGEKEAYETLEERRVRMTGILASDEIKSKASAEWIRIAGQIIDKDSSADLCAETVVRMLRGSYQKLPPTSRKISHEDGELAIALYCFKAKTDAIYEYTNLSGAVATGLHHIVKNPQWGKDPALLTYELYVLKKSIVESSVSEYALLMNQTSTEYLASLRSRYGNNPLLVQFCQDYCFWGFPVERLQKPGLPADSDAENTPVVDWLSGYFSSVVADYCDEAKFVQDVYRHFGTDVFADFLVKIGNRKSLETREVGHALISAYMDAVSEEKASILKQLLYRHENLVQEYKKRIPLLKQGSLR